MNIFLILLFGSRITKKRTFTFLWKENILTLYFTANYLRVHVLGSGLNRLGKKITELLLCIDRQKEGGIKKSAFYVELLSGFRIICILIRKSIAIAL